MAMDEIAKQTKLVGADGRERRIEDGLGHGNFAPFRAGAALDGENRAASACRRLRRRAAPVTPARFQ
jgi:hypothetical protein